MTEELTREQKMVVIERDATGTPTVWCDPEIADIVAALNKGGMRTVASCSGHGERHGNIALADGRELLIAADYDTARSYDAAISALAAHGGGYWTHHHDFYRACEIARNVSDDAGDRAYWQHQMNVLDRIEAASPPVPVERGEDKECACALCDALNATPESRHRVHALIRQHPELFVHTQKPQPAAHVAGERDAAWKWLGLLGALVCEAKNADRSSAEHHAAIDKAHTALFVWLRANAIALTSPVTTEGARVTDSYALAQLRQQVIEAHTGENADGCGMTNTQLEEITAALKRAEKGEGNG